MEADDNFDILPSDEKCLEHIQIVVSKTLWIFIPKIVSPWAFSPDNLRSLFCILCDKYFTAHIL